MYVLLLARIPSSINRVGTLLELNGLNCSSQVTVQKNVNSINHNKDPQLWKPSKDATETNLFMKASNSSQRRKYIQKIISVIKDFIA